jgi:8-oxo-dGTP pyrophosphatase MutT (NUDIX family)
MPLATLLNQPRIQRLQTALGAHTVTPGAAPSDSSRFEAAVALVLRDRGGLDVLLIKRAEIDGDPWSGHMALPGGRRDAGDSTLRETAIRETLEETGVELASRSIHLGRLSDVAPQSPRLPPMYITPHVFAVPRDSDAAPNPREVDEVLWVPLTTLASPRVRGEVTIRFENESREFPALKVEGRIVWGLTHRILTEFLDLIAPLEGLG